MVMHTLVCDRCNRETPRLHALGGPPVAGTERVEELCPSCVLARIGDLMREHPDLYVAAYATREKL